MKNGSYRVAPQGSKWQGMPYHVLAADGLTEIGEMCESHYKSRGMTGWDLYGFIAKDLNNTFKELREAALYYADLDGMPAPLVLATCREVLAPVASGGKDSLTNNVVRWLPELPGKQAEKKLAPNIETVWRLKPGRCPQTGKHEFRVYTQAGVDEQAEFYAKSPVSIFDECERGPGTVRGVGWPNVGAMVRRLLVDPDSPYYREEQHLPEDPLVAGGGELGRQQQAWLEQHAQEQQGAQAQVLGQGSQQQQQVQQVIGSLAQLMQQKQQ